MMCSQGDGWTWIWTVGAPHQGLHGLDIAADPFVVSTSELGH